MNISIYQSTKDYEEKLVGNKEVETISELFEYLFDNYCYAQGQEIYFHASISQKMKFN